MFLSSFVGLQGRRKDPVKPKKKLDDDSDGDAGTTKIKVKLKGKGKGKNASAKGKKGAKAKTLESSDDDEDTGTTDISKGKSRGKGKARGKGKGATKRKRGRKGEDAGGDGSDSEVEGTTDISGRGKKGNKKGKGKGRKPAKAKGAKVRWRGYIFIYICGHSRPLDHGMVGSQLHVGWIPIRVAFRRSISRSRSAPNFDSYPSTYIDESSLSTFFNVVQCALLCNTISWSRMGECSV